jgi:hypothetical protein
LRHLSVYLGAGGKVFVSGNGGSLDGFVVCREVGPHLFSTDPAVVIDTIFVCANARRKGIGRELMAAVVNFAVATDSLNLYAAPAFANKGMLRFLARLSFAPVAGYRVVATSTLRRLLSRDDPVTQAIAIRAKPRSSTRSSLEELIASRKRARIAAPQHRSVG